MHIALPAFAAIAAAAFAALPRKARSWLNTGLTIVAVLMTCEF